MKQRYSPEMRDVVAKAKEEAFNAGSDRIEIVHVLLGLMANTGTPSSQLLSRHGFDAVRLREKVRKGGPIAANSTAVISTAAGTLLKESAFSAFLHADQLIAPYHVLLTLVCSTNKDAAQTHLHELGLIYDTVLRELHEQDAALGARYRKWADHGVLRWFLQRTMLGRALIWAS